MHSWILLLPYLISVTLKLGRLSSSHPLIIGLWCLGEGGASLKGLKVCHPRFIALVLRLTPSTFTLHEAFAPRVEVLWKGEITDSFFGIGDVNNDRRPTFRGSNVMVLREKYK